MRKKAIFMLSLLFLVVICSCNKTYNDGDIINVDGIKYQYFSEVKYYETKFMYDESTDNYQTDIIQEGNYLNRYDFSKDYEYKIHGSYYIDMVGAKEYYIDNINNSETSFINHSVVGSLANEIPVSISNGKYKISYSRPLAIYSDGLYYFNEEESLGKNVSSIFKSFDGYSPSISLYVFDLFGEELLDFFKTPGFYVVGLAKDMDVINIPSEVNGYKVKGIGEYAFNDLDKDIEINISKIDSYFNIMPFAINSNNKIVKINSKSNLLLLSGAINKAKLELKVDKFSAMDASINLCDINSLTNLSGKSTPKYDVIEVSTAKYGPLYIEENDIRYKGYSHYLGIPIIKAIFNDCTINYLNINNPNLANNKDNLYYYNDNLYVKVEIKDEELSDELYETYIPLMNRKIDYLDLNLLGKFYDYGEVYSIDRVITYSNSFINNKNLYIDKTLLRYNNEISYDNKSLILNPKTYYNGKAVNLTKEGNNNVNLKYYEQINIEEYYLIRFGQIFDVTNTNLYVFSIFDIENNKFSRVNDVVDFENRLNNYIV